MTCELFLIYSDFLKFWVKHLSTEPDTQVYSARASYLWVGELSTQQKFREKTGISHDTQSCVHGLAVWAGV